MAQSYDFLITTLICLLLCKSITSESTQLCAIGDNQTAINDQVYRLNVQNLLDDLLYESSSSAFYNSTIGISPNKAYGLFLCRGDTTSQQCRDCIGSAHKALLDCHKSHYAISYSDNCVMRYANYSVSSKLDTDNPLVECGRKAIVKSNSPVNVTDDEKVNGTMKGMIEDLIEMAALNSTTRFAILDADLGGKDGRLYGLAQCTPDIGTGNCSACLKLAVAHLEDSCSGSMNAEAYIPSCQLRYQNVSFYGTSTSAAPAVSSFIGDGGRGGESYVISIIYFVIMGIFCL